MTGSKLLSGERPSLDSSGLQETANRLAEVINESAILDNFEFRNQIPRLSEADALTASNFSISWRWREHQ